MLIITPTILESNLLEFDEKLLKIQQLCSRIQIDVIDGNYVDNLTLLPEDWPQFPSNLWIDVHLMVLEPESWISRLKNRQIDTIIGQYESIRDMGAFFHNCIDIGKKIGIAIDIDTPATVIEDWMLTDLSSINLMAIKTGYSGQEFDRVVISKIKAVREIVGYSAEIIVDGGIDEVSGKLCVDAGADVLASNSFIWQNPEENLRKLTQLG